MGVIDGSPVNASNTNAAFLDANEDDTGFGIYTLANVESESGPTVVNIQRALNRLFDGTGIDNNTISGTDYNAPSGTIDNGDTHFEALAKLANLFHGITGHIHDGTDGNGPIVEIATATTGSQGQVSLAFIDPPPISAVGTFGTPGGTVANADHTHEGVHSVSVTGDSPVLGDIVLIPGENIQLSTSGQEITISSSGGLNSISVSGETPLMGDVILVEGSNITLTQVGQEITIAGTGGGGGSGVSVLDWYVSPNGSPEELPLDVNGLMPYWDFTVDQINGSEYATKELIAIVQIPESYTTGSQIFLQGLTLNIPQSATGNILMQSHTAFWDSLSSINLGSPEYDSTNTELTLPIGSQGVIQITGMDLTDGSGQIDSITMVPGNILRIRLSREYSSESAPCTGSVYAFRNTSFGDFS